MGIIISIHAVLWDRDKASEIQAVSAALISIHAVLWDRDWRGLTKTQKKSRFQSTRSSGTATTRHCPRTTIYGHFNPRGPLGPRLYRHGSPRERPDFNPRGPADRDLPTGTLYRKIISIRGPLGPRLVVPEHDGRVVDFNPRGPLGPRLSSTNADPVALADFNPRGPLGPRQGVFSFVTAAI